jgi:hypothetical protein
MYLSGLGIWSRVTYARMVEAPTCKNAATSSVDHQSSGKTVMFVTVQQSRCSELAKLADVVGCFGVLREATAHFGLQLAADHE